jgi:uncharacterized membrane protein HdeD (DUF308 family)
VLADRASALTVLKVIISVGLFAFAVFNFVLAIKNKDIRSVWISHVTQGIINIVLFLLVIIIPASPTLLGIIIAIWLIVFGVFEIIAASHYGQSKRSKMGILLTVIGLVVLIIPLVFSIDYLILIAIVGLVFGVFRVVLGILIKSKDTGATTSLR